MIEWAVYLYGGNSAPNRSQLILPYLHAVVHTCLNQDAKRLRFRRWVLTQTVVAIDLTRIPPPVRP